MSVDYEREYRYYKDLHEQDRDRRDQEIAQAARERDDARRARQQEAREAECMASDWPEAFRKGLRRYQQEAREELALAGQLAGTGDAFEPWFPSMVAQAEFAQQVYEEEEQVMEEQIKALRQQMLERTAARVEEKFPNSEMAEALRSDNYEFLVAW